MKTFKQRIEDFEFYCDKLYSCLKNANTERAEEFIKEIKKTSLNLSHQKKDFISIYLLNNKEIDVFLFSSLLDIKAEINKFNYSIILSLFKKNIQDENINIILSYIEDKKKGALSPF